MDTKDPQIAHLPVMAGPAPEMSAVAAHLPVSPERIEALEDEESGEGVNAVETIKELAAENVERVRSGSWWLVHSIVHLGYLICWLALCVVLAIWHFEGTLAWSWPCCGKLDASIAGLAEQGWPMISGLSGVAMWQIGAVVLGVTAGFKILLDKVRPRFTSRAEAKLAKAEATEE